MVTEKNHPTDGHLRCTRVRFIGDSLCYAPLFFLPSNTHFKTRDNFLKGGD